MQSENTDSLYYKVKQQLLDMILQMDIGSRIPTRNELTVMYNVARTTLDRAVSELIGEGYLYSRIGSGTYIISHNGTGAKKIPMDIWGILLPSVTSHNFPEMIRGAEDVCSEAGINLILCNTDNDIDKQAKYIEQLVLSGASGMIVVPAVDSSFEAQKRFENLRESGVRLVFCTRGVESIAIPKIMDNDFYGARIATNFLLERGWKRPAFLSKRFFQTVETRYCGYLSALCEHDISIDENHICFNVSGMDSIRPIYETVKNWLAMEYPPDSVFCFNDATALEVYHAVSDAGFVVGKDIGVISYDDSKVCEELSPKLTSVRPPNYDIGRLAARTLLQMINDMPVPDTQLIILEPELIVRESC